MEQIPYNAKVTFDWFGKRKTGRYIGTHNNTTDGKIVAQIAVGTYLYEAYLDSVKVVKQRVFESEQE